MTPPASRHPAPAVVPAGAASAPAAGWNTARRLSGLRRFALAITVLNVLGHTVLGFEQSWAHPVVALLTAYFVELILEWVESRLTRRRPRFLASPVEFVDFLLSAHISGLAVSMLLYPNERLMPVVFASAAAIGSKAIFRVMIGNRMAHFFNPSNFGISLTLLLFPWVGIAPPYQFTENLHGWADWIIPVVILFSGSFLNWKFTQKLPLIAAWVGGFLVQAALRSAFFGTPFAAALMPMTGVAFVLYTFYMVTDPATTPSRPLHQVMFGAAVAAVYGMLMVLHVVFGLFFALSIVCLLRGLGHFAYSFAVRRQPALVPASAPQPQAASAPVVASSRVSAP